MKSSTTRDVNCKVQELTRDKSTLFTKGNHKNQMYKTLIEDIENKTLLESWSCRKVLTSYTGY